MNLYKNIFKYTGLSIVFLLFVTACSTEDFTGDSTVKPSTPTITITGGGSFTSNEAAATKYDYTISIDEVQVSDVYVYATVTEGTAVDGVNYTLSDGKIVIPANSLSTAFSVQILSTTTANETLTFKLQIGDERTGNANVTPSMSDFTITNATDDMLVAGMSWETDIESATGVSMDPEDAVDMRMLIVDASDMSIVATEDGGSFEEYDQFHTLPDGDYLIAADIYATVDLGDINEALSISLQLDFYQLGTISTVLAFPDVMTNEFACDAYRTNLATVTVASGSYTIVESVSYVIPDIEGDWILDMQDSFGDGWNGAAVTFEIDGVGTDYTIADGLTGQEIITVPGGTTSLKFFFTSGDWDSEVTFQITGPNAVEVGDYGPSPAAGEFTVDGCLL